MRQQQNNNVFKIFPKLLTVIILAFYTDDMDEFNPDLCSKHIKISNNNMKITHKLSNETPHRCYGTKVISAKENDRPNSFPLFTL